MGWILPWLGVAALAGAEVITNLVNNASEQQSSVIDVPDSDYQLNYASVDSVGSGGADFSYAVAGSAPLKGAANCQQGLLGGQVPSTAAQAQLLNAACQVAYGPDPKGTPCRRAWLAGCRAGPATCSCWPSGSASQLRHGGCFAVGVPLLLRVASTMRLSPAAEVGQADFSFSSTYLSFSLPFPSFLLP